MCCLCVDVVYQCGGEERSLRQYWYTSWPDQKTPDKAPPLLELVQEVERAREEAPPSSGPTIVHCRYESFVCYVCCEGMSIFFIVQSSGVWSPHGGFHIKQINQSIRQSIHLLLLRPSSHPTFFLFRSAGIGRTGCFIATSILCKQLRTEGVVDILRTTCQLRLDRWGILRIYPSSPLSLVLGTESLSSVDLVPKRRVTGSHCGVEIEMLTIKI